MHPCPIADLLAKVETKVLARDWQFDVFRDRRKTFDELEAAQVILHAVPYDHWHDSDVGYMQTYKDGVPQPLPDHRVGLWGDLLVGFYLDPWVPDGAQLKVTYGECVCPPIPLKGGGTLTPALGGRYAAPIGASHFSPLLVEATNGAKPWAVYAYLASDSRNRLATTSGVAVPGIGFLCSGMVLEKPMGEIVTTWPVLDPELNEFTERIARKRIGKAILEWGSRPGGPFYRHAKTRFARVSRDDTT